MATLVFDPEGDNGEETRYTIEASGKILGPYVWRGGRWVSPKPNEKFVLEGRYQISLTEVAPPDPSSEG